MKPRASFLRSIGMAWVMTAACAGQMHHVDAPEHVTRAVGVYEWTGELHKPSASRFVPVSLFINGHFEDAGLYLARPVPFALQSGDLYTVERSGEPQGVLDLDNAARVVTGNALADDNPTGAWYGFGTFQAEAPPKPGPSLHRSAHPASIQTTSTSGATQPTKGEDTGDDGRPHMSRRNGSNSGDGNANGTPAETGQSSPSGSASSRRTEDQDTDRPTLARRDPAQDASRKKPSVGGKKGTASVTAVGPQPGDDPDRPTLSHKVAADEGPKPLTGTPADMHQAVAVSDAASRDPHPFARAWDDAAERSTTLTALQVLAKAKVQAYLSANNLLPFAGEVVEPQTGTHSNEGIAANVEEGQGAPPKLQRGKPAEYGSGNPGNTKTATKGTTGASASRTSSTHSARSMAAKKSVKAQASAPLLLRAEELRPFTLSYGGLPVFVYTASVSTVRAGAGGDLPAAATHPIVFLTMVAQRLPSGDLQPAMVSVTDSLHLDRNPRLRLIDAVDPDASHRASLLFEMRGNNNRQFALYRLISARAENTFTSASIE